MRETISDSANTVQVLDMDASSGEESARGRWADGPSPDGRGTFSYAKAEPLDEEFGPPPADLRLVGGNSHLVGASVRSIGR